jgi:hypothetical protein
VTYGMLRDHVARARADAAALAATLLLTMLPPHGTHPDCGCGPDTGGPMVNRGEYAAAAGHSAHNGHAVIEIPVLSTVRQVAALSQASPERRLTTAQLIRRTVAEFLAGREPAAARQAPACDCGTPPLHSKGRP